MLAGFRRTKRNAFNCFVGHVFANSRQICFFLAYLQIHGNIVFDILAFKTLSNV